MPDTGPAESSTSSFAGFLASIATPQKGAVSPWDDDLADDIATISYEQALRAQASCEPPSTESQPVLASTSCISTLRTTTGTPQADARPEAVQSPSASTPDCRRTASITIRLSEQECARLRLRAAEAGLSVSAYLRSCTLEVESLRTQVKETLTELRQSSAKPPEPSIPPTPSPTPTPANWRRLWPFGHSRRAVPPSPARV